MCNTTTSCLVRPPLYLGQKVGVSLLGKIDFSSLLGVGFAIELSKKHLLKTSLEFIVTNIYQLIESCYEK